MIAYMQCQKSTTLLFICHCIIELVVCIVYVYNNVECCYYGIPFNVHLCT